VSLLAAETRGILDIQLQKCWLDPTKTDLSDNVSYTRRVLAICLTMRLGDNRRLTSMADSMHSPMNQALGFSRPAGSDSDGVT
jgi:hypothetical protein